VSQENRMLPGSPHAEIRIGLQLRAGPFHARIGCRDGFDVELQMRRYGELVVGLLMPSFAETSMPATIEALCECDALDGHPPGQQSRYRRAGQPQRTSDEPTHASG